MTTKNVATANGISQYRCVGGKARARAPARRRGQRGSGWHGQKIVGAVTGHVLRLDVGRLANSSLRRSLRRNVRPACGKPLRRSRRRFDSAAPRRSVDQAGLRASSLRRSLRSAHEASPSRAVLARGLTGGVVGPSGRPVRGWLPRPRKLSRGNRVPLRSRSRGAGPTSADRLPVWAVSHRATRSLGRRPRCHERLSESREPSGLAAPRCQPVADLRRRTKAQVRRHPVGMKFIANLSRMRRVGRRHAAAVNGR